MSLVPVHCGNIQVSLELFAVSLRQRTAAKVELVIGYNSTHTPASGACCDLGVIKVLSRHTSFFQEEGEMQILGTQVLGKTFGAASLLGVFQLQSKMVRHHHSEGPKGNMIAIRRDTEVLDWRSYPCMISMLHYPSSPGPRNYFSYKLRRFCNTDGL